MTKSTIITNIKPGFHEKSDGVTLVSGQEITDKTPEIIEVKPLKIIPKAAKVILNTGVHKNKKTTSKINKSVFGFILQIMIKLFFVFKLCEERWVPQTKKSITLVVIIKNEFQSAKFEHPDQINFHHYE